MKTKEFKKYLDKAKKVINLKSSLYILQNVKFSNGVMTVSDLEVDYSFKHEKFIGLNCLIDFDKLFRIVSKLKDVDFELKQESERFSIITSKGNLNLSAEIDMNDFPVMPSDLSPIGQVKSEHLPLIKKALNYVSDDDLRPNMTGVFLDNTGYICGSDAHILGHYKCNPISTSDIILRQKTCRVLDFEANVFSDNKHTKFYSDTESVTQRNIDSKYPQWAQVIPQDNPNELKVDTNDLSERLELALLTGNQASGLVKLDLSIENIEISSKCIDFDSSFNSKLPGKYFGDSLQIGFKNQFMQKIIKTEKCKAMVIKMSDPTRAIIINNEILLMPMMLND